MSNGKLDKDIVVLRHPGVLPPKAAKYIKEAFKQIFAEWGCDVHILLLEEGMDISVIKKDDRFRLT